MRFSFIIIIQQELDEMKSMWNTHYIREVRHSEWPPGWTNILYVTPEQSGGRSFRFPVNEMDINSCHPFCELLDVNGCTNETHELVRLIMQEEEEQEFPSNAAEAKKYFYFHHKKHRITTTLMRAFIIRTTPTLYCTDILLMGRKFSERKFLRWKFLQFQPIYPKLVQTVKISKLQELIPQLWKFYISDHVSSLYFFS